MPSIIPSPIREIIYTDYTFLSHSGAGVFYAAGFYNAPAAKVTLTNLSLSQTLGVANVSYAAHVFIVAGGVGTVDTGEVGIRVTGTSITDDAVRSTGDTEDLTTDITTLSTNDYLETTKKFIGQVTISLVELVPNPAAYTVDFNYGFAKYDDLGNRNFQIRFFESVGIGGATDAGFDIRLLHHKTSGWTYHATVFVPGASPICSLQTDHNTEYALASGIPFAYKRVDLRTFIRGAAQEGFIIEITPSQPNSIKIMDMHIGVFLR